MTDLISRQDAMALLVDIFDETCPEACLEALNNMPAVKATSRRDDWVMIP